MTYSSGFLATPRVAPALGRISFIFTRNALGFSTPRVEVGGTTVADVGVTYGSLFGEDKRAW